MSEHWFEIIKLLIDKGLLAITAILVGYLFSKWLERYKAHNIYFQRLSETRIQAYQEVSKIIGTQLIHVFTLIEIASPGAQFQGDNFKTSYLKAFEDHKASFFENEATIMKNFIFFPSHLKKL